MEAGAFPSDQYAVETQVQFYRNLLGESFPTANEAIVEIAPRPGEKILREEDILGAIQQHAGELALVLMGGINYYTGQWFNLENITAAAHSVGALAGFDLAHAIGNMPLQLHAWNVDFAAWCSYKYLNGGPGAVGGIYIHEKYAQDTKHVRAGGWWGNDEKTRFRMEKGFFPKPDASGWNLSTAQVFNMVNLKTSLEIFDRSSMEAIRQKSVSLTGYLSWLLSQLENIHFEQITPADPDARGAQLSLFFKERGKEIHQRMLDAGIVVDYREPGVIRVAPAPLYNSYEDVFQFYGILASFE